MITKRDEYLLKRRQKEITQKEIAQSLGINQSTISRYERGIAEMSQKKIEKYRSYIDQKEI